MNSPATSPITVFLVFLRLGLTSFGGPVAHIGYFRTEFVTNRRWFDEQGFSDIVALCQFLPGPASSQTGIMIGLLRAGLPGALAAWIGFTLPSALIMFGAAALVARSGDLTGAVWFHGLKLVAVAVVAQAVLGMARSLCPDLKRTAIALTAAAAALLLPAAWAQVGIMVLAGIVGWLFVSHRALQEPGAPLPIPVSPRAGASALIAFAFLLAGLPLLAAHVPAWHGITLISSFFRSGALVFGGGHVVLPLLQAAVVPPGWIGNDKFLAGYGIAQAIPGPLFTFAVYLGAIMEPEPNGWRGGTICLVAIFLPSFLLVIGIVPFWNGLRRRQGLRAALDGINAAVVGLLLAALYTPVWTSAVHSALDFGLALAAFVLLTICSSPPWLVVILGTIGYSVILRAF